jgi:CheY-like chemotaxis protein
MKTILIADDNDANRELISVILEREGYRVIEASHGREAITVAQQQRPDLVLLDIHMPQMNGFETVRAFRTDPDLRQTPVVALTASAMAGDAEAALSHGFDSYLAKPYEISEVVALVKKMAGGSD